MNKPKRVMVADDDKAIVDAICLYLEFEGYEATFTYDGNTLLTLSEPLPDMIILDIWMSGVDGTEVCKKLKQDPEKRQIPILMISASQDLKKSAEDAGADCFLAKPFDIHELIARIEGLTNK